MRSQRWKMSAMFARGRGSRQRGVCVYVRLFGYVTPAVLLDSGEGEEHIIHHQETIKDKKLLPSWPVMWETVARTEPLLGLGAGGWTQTCPPSPSHRAHHSHTRVEIQYAFFSSFKKMTKNCKPQERRKAARFVPEGWPAPLVMCGIQTAQPVLLEGDRFNNKTGVKTTSLIAKVGAVITVSRQAGTVGVWHRAVLSCQTGFQRRSRDSSWAWRKSAALVFKTFSICGVKTAWVFLPHLAWVSSHWSVFYCIYIGCVSKVETH